MLRMPIFILALLVFGFAAGCSMQSISPTGLSVCAPPQLEEAAALAVNYWNMAGAKFDSPSCPAQVNIKIVDSIDPSAPGVTGRTLQNSASAPSILIEQSVVDCTTSTFADDRAYAIRVIAHELGHALGFSHVNDPDSAMYPVTREKPLPENPGETDTGLIRGLF